MDILQQLHPHEDIDGKAVTLEFAGIELVARCHRMQDIPSTVRLNNSQLPCLLHMMNSVLKATSLGHTVYTSGGHSSDSDAPTDRVLQPHEMACLTLSACNDKAVLGVLGHTVDTFQVQ